MTGSIRPKKQRPPPTPAPTEEIEAAAEAARVRERRASGRASTILTNQLGGLSQPSTAVKRLLGE